MRIHQLNVEDALASLDSGPEGIGQAEAKRRLAEFGANQVERIETTPLLVRFLRQFSHFFALILWFAAALALFAEIHQPGEGMGVLALAIVGVVLINGLFSFWQEYRSERALLALRNLLPQMVAVEREGALIELPASDLVPGDVIRLREGDSIPADCRLIEALGVQVVEMARLAARRNAVAACRRGAVRLRPQTPFDLHRTGRVSCCSPRARSRPCYPFAALPGSRSRP